MESPGEETGRTAPPGPHTPAGTQPNGSNKIIGRNVNGTSKSRNSINFLMFIFFFIKNDSDPINDVLKSNLRVTLYLSGQVISFINEGQF